MKKLFTLFLLLFGFQSVFAQLNFLPNFIRKMYLSKDTSKRSSFVLVPALSSSPETGIEFGGAALLSFYTDTVGDKTRVSNVFGYSSITTKGQTKLSLNASYWLPDNSFHYTASIAYYNYPYDFYGIGNNTRLADVQHVLEKRYRATFNGEKKIGDYLYIGYVSGALKYFYQYTLNQEFILHNNPDVQDRHGGASIYIGPSFTYDSRNNNTYTTSGMIINAYYNLMHGVYFNNSYEGGFFNIEYSQFFLLAKPLVLGLDVQEQSLTGGRSPFYLLPELGSDGMMRGYYEGRYRDRNLIAGQAELRYRFAKRFALAGFAGTGEVSDSQFSVPQLKPNYGGGIRYFFDVQKGLTIRMDYGVGEKPAGEPRESGLYIALGEAF